MDTNKGYCEVMFLENWKSFCICIKEMRPLKSKFYRQRFSLKGKIKQYSMKFVFKKFNLGFVNVDLLFLIFCFFMYRVSFIFSFVKHDGR